MPCHLLRTFRKSVNQFECLCAYNTVISSKIADSPSFPKLIVSTLYEGKEVEFEVSVLGDVIVMQDHFLPELMV